MGGTCLVVFREGMPPEALNQHGGDVRIQAIQWRTPHIPVRKGVLEDNIHQICQFIIKIRLEIGGFPLLFPVELFQPALHIFAAGSGLAFLDPRLGPGQKLGELL